MMNKKIPRILFRFLQGIPELKIWNRSFFPSFKNYAYIKHKLLLIKGMFFYVLKSVYRQLRLDIPRHVAT